MSVTNTRMRGWVKLPSDAAYATLKSTGTYTQDGVTISYDETTAYITPSDGIGGKTLQGNTAVVTNASGEVVNSGVTSTELSYVANARSNIQKQIDDLKSQIGVGTGTYFADSYDAIDRTKPGTWYTPNGDGTYFQWIEDDTGTVMPVKSRVDPSEIGVQDLTAYQKKIDADLSVKNKSGIPQTTVVGSINAIEEKLGDSIITGGYTVTSAINQLLAGGGGGSGTVTLTAGNNGVTIANLGLGNYTISHAEPGTTAATTYGSILSPGSAKLPLVTTDAYGHTTSGTALATFYVPSAGGTNGQVWTWDAANNRGTWTTPTGGGGSSYTATNGITIDGTVIKHTNSGQASVVGETGDALKVTIDDQGHVTAMSRTSGTSGQYLDDAWKWVSPKNDADSIIKSGTAMDRLVNANAINDIMGGMRLKKMTQSQYDSLGTKDANTVYIIVN